EIGAGDAPVNRFGGHLPRAGMATLWVGRVAIVLVAWWAGPACGKEQAEEFAAGLRNRGLYELTLDYLSRMENSRLADDAFRQRIAYWRGMTLIDQARQGSDADEQKKLLDRARAELDRFAEANPASAAGAEAQTQLAIVLVEEAKRLANLANELPRGSTY